MTREWEWMEIKRLFVGECAGTIVDSCNLWKEKSSMDVFGGLVRPTTMIYSGFRIGSRLYGSCYALPVYESWLAIHYPHAKPNAALEGITSLGMRMGQEPEQY